MHVLPTDLHDVGRHLHFRVGVMVNLCTIIGSTGRSPQNAEAQMLVWTSRRAFALLRFVDFCQ